MIGKYYRVCRDEFTVKVTKDEDEAINFLKALKLGKFNNGYLDLMENGEHVMTLYHKQTTNGPLLDVS